MEMKWHPIVNGDLSGIQQQETLLFTLFDEKQNENYVTTGWILEDEGELVVRGVDPWGLNSNETKKVKAWMELPEPMVDKNGRPESAPFPSMIVIFRNNSERGVPIRLITYACMEDPISVSES